MIGGAGLPTRECASSGEVAALRAVERTGRAGVPRVCAYGIGGRGCACPWLELPYFPYAMWREPGGDGGWLEPYRGDVERVR